MSNHAKRARKFAAVGGGVLVAAPIVGAATGAGVAHATSYEVTTLADSGAGSLRDAIVAANGNSGADTITFQAGLTGTISVDAQMRISDAVTIVGPGASSLILDGGGSDRVFYLYGGPSVAAISISGLTVTNCDVAGHGGGIYALNAAVTLDDVHLEDNSTTGSKYGGGLMIEGTGSLTITDSEITGNTASYGGGVYVKALDGTLAITDTLFDDNYAYNNGGGFYLSDTPTMTLTRVTVTNNEAGGSAGGASIDVPEGASVTIADSIFSDNVAAEVGGGVDFFSTRGDLNISGTTVSGNTAGGDGGGLYFDDVKSDVVIVESTISGNSSGGVGGGIDFGGIYGSVEIVNATFSGNTALYGGAMFLDGLYDTTPFTVSHTTITGNSATATDPRYNGGGGIYVNNTGWSSAGDVVLNHTVVSGNTATLPGNDILAVYGGFVGNWSMVGDLDGSTLGGANNLPEGDAMLGALADNGGLTKTHLPLAGSPLLDAGDPAFASPPSTDQRGQARVAYGRIDIGAVEVGALPPTGSSSGLLAGLGAALLAIGGAMHLGGRRRTQQS